MGGLFSSLFGSKSAKAVDPFTGEHKKDVIDPLKGDVASIAGKFDANNLFNAFNPNQLLQQTQQGLTGFQPGVGGAFGTLEGAKGILGGAQGFLGNAANMVSSDPLGAGGFFSRVLDPSFTDVNLDDDAEVQGVLDAIQNSAGRAFNIGADKIQSSAQRASGGVGAGTAGTANLERLSGDLSSRVADQSGQFLMDTLLKERSRKGGIQQAAAQQALGHGIRQGTAMGQLGGQLGNIGSIFGDIGATQGQLGLGQGQQELSKLGQMGNLGNILQQLGISQQQMPLALQFQLGNLLKSGSASADKGIFQRFGEGIQGLNQGIESGGSAAAGIMSMFSDERLKAGIEPAKMDGFLDSLKPYNFTYKNDTEHKPKVGVMAQDVEATPEGRTAVLDTEEGKAISIPDAVSLILASLASINQRLRKLEGNDG